MGALDSDSVRLLHPGRNCWRTVRADRFSLIVDAASYFRHLKSAMLAARHSILLIGWDFDTRVRLDPERHDPDWPDKLGAFINKLVERAAVLARAHPQMGSRRGCDPRARSNPALHSRLDDQRADRLQARPRASARRLPPPEDRGHRRRAGLLRRHRRHGRALGHARAPGRGSPRAPAPAASASRPGTTPLPQWTGEAARALGDLAR